MSPRSVAPARVASVTGVASVDVVVSVTGVVSVTVNVYVPTPSPWPRAEM